LKIYFYIYYKEEFSVKNDIDYDKLFRQFVHNQCENGVWSSAPQKFHLISHTINLTDVYGQWEKDLFFGQMKIFVKAALGENELNNSSPNYLPKSWRTDETKINQFPIQRILKCKEKTFESVNKNDEDDDQDLNLTKMDVATFIRKFLVKHNRLKYERQLKSQLDRMYVNTVKDLIELPAHSWESMQQQHNLGPIITPLLKKDIEQFRLNAKTSGKKVKAKSAEEMLAATFADIHKIKRYLFYEASSKVYDKNKQEKAKGDEKKLLIDTEPYLSKKALKMGFEAQRKDGKFDGGPVLSKIQSYLEDNFATPELPDIVNASRGMILVKRKY
jgi:hypothetical protein